MRRRQRPARFRANEYALVPAVIPRFRFAAARFGDAPFAGLRPKENLFCELPGYC
jgi:hypothetical protein